MLTYSPTPTQEIRDPVLDKTGVRLIIKREDLNHPHVSGNKWWKLKYNLEEAKRQGKQTLLTFGGAYSNHLFATASAANELGLKAIGLVRGEETLPLNHTLSFAKSRGMELHYISRELYRKKNEKHFSNTLHDKFGDFFLIPEGGTNELAVKGVAEFAQTLGSDFDYLCCAVGTGGTLAGLIHGLPDSKQIIGFSSLKGGGFLDDVMRSLITKRDNWKLNHDYHFGGYAKTTTELAEFIKQIEKKFTLPLDPVYTSKLLFGALDLIKKSYFEKGSTVLIIHSGGLQGKN